MLFPPENYVWTQSWRRVSDCFSLLQFSWFFLAHSPRYKKLSALVSVYSYRGLVFFHRHNTMRGGETANKLITHQDSQLARELAPLTMARKAPWETGGIYYSQHGAHRVWYLKDGLDFSWLWSLLLYTWQFSTLTRGSGNQNHTIGHVGKWNEASHEEFNRRVEKQ